MTWSINDNHIYDEKNNIICLEVSPPYITLIKKTPEIFDLISDFVIKYDERRKITKELHDKFVSIIKGYDGYDFKWKVDENGDIIDEKQNSICIFPQNKNMLNVLLIKHLPDIVKAIRNCINNFPEQRQAYKEFCEIQENVLDH